MASEIWTIKYGGDTKTAAEWGIEDVQLVLRSLDSDELSFRVPSADIFEDCPFEYDQTIELFRSGVRKFKGKVQPPATSADGEEESWRVTALNAWRALEETIYQQNVVEQTEDFSSLVGRYSTQVVLGQDPWGHKISVNAQVLFIGNYAISQGVPLRFESALPGIFVPLADANNISCAAAILRQCEWYPACGSYVDYTIDPLHPEYEPTIFFGPRGDMEVVSIDLDVTKPRGLSSLRKRSDLVPRGVAFTFIILAYNAALEKWVPRGVIYQAGETSGQRVIFATFQLANQNDPDHAEPVPTEAAGSYYEALSTAFWEGEITLVERECSGEILPSHALNLVNGNEAWETMDAIINSVTLNLKSGATTIALGLPATLSASDFAALMARARNTTPASDFGNNNNNGDEGVPPGDGGVGPNPDAPGGSGNPNAGNTNGSNGGNTTREIEICEGGVIKKIRVLGA